MSTGQLFVASKRQQSGDGNFARCAVKTVKQIDILFGMETHDDPRHIVLNGGLPVPL